jgi:hypothetical protein
VADGRARVIVGPQPAALTTLGDVVLAHDLLAVRFDESDPAPLVRPTYPQLMRLAHDPSMLPRIQRDAARCAIPYPLESIYLTDGDGAVEPREAFISLFQSLLHQHQDLDGVSARAYRMIGRLAATIPVRRLREHDATSIIAG